eukprot:TRINITY_DN11324_c0_g1_i2.p1 TRINITY_DN11324_c0_g1~~TRINITY_DN11324_c0_g1_i2.p1  ORF type:complete len:905 (+),score=217.21 TRINITY_DN11324_c0_g1_i2:153-2867(+)
MSMVFMSSEGPAFPRKQEGERLGIWTAERVVYEDKMPACDEAETRLEYLASQKFMMTKTMEAKAQYKALLEQMVESRRASVRIVPGSAYPGPYPGGFVLLFGVFATESRHYFREVSQAMNFVGLSPRRYYLESFRNGAITYALFFPFASEEQMKKLENAILWAALFNPDSLSAGLYSEIMSGAITHELGLYLKAGVKFAYAFFPREQYAPEYLSVHRLLEKDPWSQRKLEALYKLCMKGLLSMERIYDIVQRHLSLAKKLFQNFKNIALGHASPQLDEDLAKAIDAEVTDRQERQILRLFTTFNASILMTNFYKAGTPRALVFRLDPEVVLKDRPHGLYPERPYGIYLVCGRTFLGFHVRFRDVARGGIRLVLSRDENAYERNYASLFDECYNLALTQQAKNKDIPEGGSKGVILPEFSPGMTETAAKACFTSYLDALLDCMLAEQVGLHTGHMNGKKEMLYFGPDENTAGYMDLGAEMAKQRGYQYWKALTTGKSVDLGGVPHDTHGMTTCSVHTYVTELLRELGEKEEDITKFQTGGPDGDLGSNEILISKDKTTGIVDGSGVIHDPAGLNRQELVRLAQGRLTVKHFDRALLGKDGFLVTVDQKDVKLKDGSEWSTGVVLRDNFHLTAYAAADLFVPCGGRPNSVTSDNVKKFFKPCGTPKFRMIVEGANLFLTDGSRRTLEQAGVHVFKDASTNKGGVCSSSLEVFAALALSKQDHTNLMTYKKAANVSAPAFYSRYVEEILSIISENARLEFNAIWKANKSHGLLKIDGTRRLSAQINAITDNIQGQFDTMPAAESDILVRSVVAQAVPPLMIEHLGVEGILQQVPQNYIRSLVASWIASRYVYKHGVFASEVSFFFFMKSLFGTTQQGGPAAAAETAAVKRKPEEDGEVGANKRQCAA